MCYLIILSSTSTLDFSNFNNKFVEFEKREEPVLPEEQTLIYPNKWLAVSPDGCSCDFRHVDENLGFGLPEDWYPEDKDAIEATEYFIEFVRKLVDSGERLDCINIWLDDQNSTVELNCINVQMNEISKNEFRFHGLGRYEFN